MISQHSHIWTGIFCLPDFFLFQFVLLFFNPQLHPSRLFRTVCSAGYFLQLLPLSLNNPLRAVGSVPAHSGPRTVSKFVELSTRRAHTFPAPPGCFLSVLWIFFLVFLCYLISIDLSVLQFSCFFKRTVFLCLSSCELALNKNLSFLRHEKLRSLPYFCTCTIW